MAPRDRVVDDTRTEETAAAMAQRAMREAQEGAGCIQANDAPAQLLGSDIAGESYRKLQAEQLAATAAHQALERQRLDLQTNAQALQLAIEHARYTHVADVVETAAGFARFLRTGTPVATSA